MLIETKPNLKVEKLTGVTANTSFTLPANHAIQAVYVTNSGGAGAALELKNGSNVLLGFQAGGVNYRLYTPDGNGADIMYSSSQTIDLVSTSGWTNVSVSVLVVLLDLGV